MIRADPNKIVLRAAWTAGNSQDGTILGFVMVEHVLHLATIAIGTKMGTATCDHIEGSSLHLTRHLSNHQARTKVGRNTVNRVTETSKESVVVAVLAKAIKWGVNRHIY